MLLLLVVGPVRAAEGVAWLYEVAVPVSDQSAAERDRASSEALSRLLVRLTGLSEVPRTPEVAAALAAPQTYYSEFSFAAAEDGGLDLVIQFDQDPVQALIRAAGLPIWRSYRERVLVWAVLQQGGERTLVGAASDLPLVNGLTAEARARGLPLTLPLLDLQDQLAVDPAAVWGRLSQVVDAASARYDADIVVLGRITADGSGGFASDWEFWIDGTLIPYAAEGDDLEGQGVALVDLLADELAARRVVHAREANQLAISVSGVTSPAGYGALLAYLGSLEFVESVGVAGVRDGRLWLMLETPAEPARLLATFERDGQLTDDQLALVDSADLRLVWRGGD
jgi:hypothetical protein